VSAVTPDEQALARAVVDKMLAVDGFSRWLGISVLEIAPGRAVVRMTVRDEMINGFRTAHGGIVFSLADSALAFSTNTGGFISVAMDCTISYPAAEARRYAHGHVGGGEHDEQAGVLLGDGREPGRRGRGAFPRHGIPHAEAALSGRDRMTEAFIVDGVRTPIGTLGGALSAVRADDLAAHVIARLLARGPDLDPAALDDVILGCANQAGEDNRNVARMALLLAGLPVRCRARPSIACVPRA
jgi:acyl-coenzyme A thioesterase PaaI-like protein